MGTTEIGVLIREARRRLGLTQEELAKRVPGLTQNYVTQIERGRMRPSTEKIALLSEATGIPYNDLMVAAGYIRDEDRPEVERERRDRMEAEIFAYFRLKHPKQYAKLVRYYQAGTEDDHEHTVEHLAEFFGLGVNTLVPDDAPPDGRRRRRPAEK